VRRVLRVLVVRLVLVALVRQGLARQGLARRLVVLERRVPEPQEQQARRVLVRRAHPASVVR
jgi:hypothetical protein